MRPIYFVFLVVISAILITAQTSQQDTERFDEYGRWIHGTGEPWFMNSSTYNSEQAKIFRTRWANLEAATTETTNEWAGEYFLPGLETSVVSLRWTNESGFVFLHANTCMAAVVNLSYGGVYADSAEVMLLPEIGIVSTDQGDDFFLDMLRTKYIPVKWDGVHYLVPEKNMKTFFGMFAGRKTKREQEERVFVRFFEKSGDAAEHDSLDNIIVPYGYDKYIRKPINAAITKVGNPKLVHGAEEYNRDELSWATTVTINAGSAKGVRGGTKFKILSSDIDDPVEVTRVFRDHSIGIITRPFYDGTETDEAAELREKFKGSEISLGWKLTTFSRYAPYE